MARNDRLPAADQTQPGKGHNVLPVHHDLTPQMVAIDRLTPLGHATRKHPHHQISKLKRMIARYGILRPVLVDQSFRVIDGSAIIEATQALGVSEIPVIVVSDLDEASLRAARLALNRSAEDASWEQAELAREFCAILEIESDFELNDTGFEMAEIDLSFGNDGREDEDIIPPPDPGPPVSRPGDLWQLGPHLLLCADCLADGSFERLLAGSAARMSFTDPPYNMRISDVSGFGSIKHKEFANGSGEMSDDEYRGFLSRVCELLVRHSAAGSLHYMCIDWRHVADLIAVGGPVFDELKNICTWAKAAAGQGSFYRSQTEFVCVFKSGRAPHINNIKLGRFGRNRSNLWTYAGQTSLGAGKRKSGLHPTVKPLALVADAILDASNRGEIVLDPFGGSGTTLVAAEKTGRLARLIEIDPAYVDLTIRRFEAYTGQNARLYGDGRTFAEIANDRGLRSPSAISTAHEQMWEG